MWDDSPAANLWLKRLQVEGEAALAALFDHHRPELRRMVELRLDGRVAARVDPSDVLQEAFLDLTRSIQGYLRQPDVKPYVWLRRLTWERLLKVHRLHLDARCRAVGRELPLPADTSMVLAHQLLPGAPGPSETMIRDELQRRVRRAMAKLDGGDLEVILMRNFEEMSNNEVAQVLGLTPSAATMRHGRALIRLKQILIAEGLEGDAPP